MNDRSGVRSIDAGAPPVRFARGWHCLGLAARFRDGSPHAIEAFGTKLVVFAGETGELHVLDGYCRHMGGDLSRGTIKGNAIACPFHDWRWGPDGKCAKIPYSRRVPPTARTRSWLTLEQNQQLFVWHDPQGNLPPADVTIPRIEGAYSADWSNWTWDSLPVDANCREVVDNRPTDFRTFLLPRADYAIEDVWDTVGLRGTGSNDIVVESAFVPIHRSLSFADVFTLVCPGQELNPGPLFRLPYGSVFSYGITTPIIGMAAGAYEAHVAYTRERVRVAYVGQKAAQDPFAQVRIAEAAAEIDGAWLALERNMTDLMGCARAGEPISVDLRLRVRRDQVRGTGQAIRAVDRLFENSGGRALKVGTPIQRFWRDAHAGRVHAINDPERALSMYGGGEFGLPVPADAML